MVQGWDGSQWSDVPDDGFDGSVFSDVPVKGFDGQQFVRLDTSIPDSGLLHNWDWSQASSAATITDQAGNADLTSTGDPTLNGSISGVQAGLTDGSDDEWATSFTTIPQPFQIFVVGQLLQQGSTHGIYGTVTSGGFVTLYDNNGSWRINNGSGVDDGPSDTNEHLFDHLANGESSELNIDGVNKLSTGTGTNDMSDIAIGSLGGTSFGNLNVGQVLIYDTTASGYSASDVRQYLNSKWAVY